MENRITEIIESIIGDTPVSVQLAMALDDMATKEHQHEEYATKFEVEDLRKKIDMLIDLVGDVSVSEQIYTAIKER
jgi:hypothetical protein